MTDYVKLTAYFDERLRHGDRFTSDALLDLYGENAVATSIVLRGIASFGPHHVLRTDQSLTMSENSPIAVTAVDEADKMAGLADQVSAMMVRGLVTLERAQLGGTGAPPDAAKLTIYIGRQDRADGRPAHRAVCDVLHRLGFAGASVFLGVDGTARGDRKRATFFSRNIGVPVMIIAVGTGGQVAAALPELETLLREPLFTVERAHLCKRDGEVLSRPVALPAADRARTGAVAEADGLHVGGGTARRRADPSSDHSTTVRLTDGQRGDGVARHLGISRRSRTAR